ncbi:hypothetical protein EV363DRAFT_1260385 [Boletus edulis]|nr:hypothetical protein EV363DRAFT_1260385 [Boletus edulis]
MWSSFVTRAKRTSLLSFACSCTHTTRHMSSLRLHVTLLDEPECQEHVVPGEAMRDKLRSESLQTRVQPNACSRSDFHLIELDWSPELWVAYHDADKQNAHLASQLREGNVFDHAEGYLGDVLDFLGASCCFVGSYCIA